MSPKLKEEFALTAIDNDLFSRPSLWGGQSERVEATN
jgi:hypothetical protein